jgi:hypothetical protein
LATQVATVAASSRHGMRIVTSVAMGFGVMSPKKKGTPAGYLFLMLTARYMPRQEPGRYFRLTVVPVPPQSQPKSVCEPPV